MKQPNLIKRTFTAAAALTLIGLLSTGSAPVALAQSAPLGLDSPRLVLKGGPHFLVLDPDGMIPTGQGSPYGLFEDDTRFLSQWEVLLNDNHIHPLTAFTREGYTGTFLYGNPPSDALPAQSILLKREMVLQDGFCERLTVQSYVDTPLKFKLSVLFGADFFDMFEVRGQKRLKHGVSVYAKSGGKYVTTYTGVDKSVVTSTVTYPGAAATMVKPDERKLDFEINLAPRGKQVLELNVGNTLATASLTRAAAEVDKGQSFAAKKAEAERELANWQDVVATIKTDNEPLNKMIDQAARDIFLLRQNTPKGPCLAAGLPWYAVAFGRDQSVTGLQMLTFAPSLSKQILQVLANYQGTKVDKFTEEQPGRILHELRLGEMARSREIPFIPFYGSIDSTPLWLLLLNRYVDTTGDIALAKQLWPNVEAALGFLDRQTNDKFGGFLSYGGQGKSFLSNQCWKDSSDSIMNKDGTLAKQPIAACEVQGYLYKIYVDTAKLAKQLGHDDVAASLTQKAAALKDNFQKQFWMEDEHFVALALDGDNKKCAVISSNPGQLLFTGILEKAQADKVVERMMQKDMFTGWGLRTLASSEVKYNPMSYHDGTVWPHDNAITIEGMAETGHTEAAQTVMSSLIDTATTASDYRLPELFCGFNRGDFDTPVPYPVSCVPQAWAAGSIFEMLKATLGINLSADKITVDRPTLPRGVNKLTVDNLHCAGKRVKLVFIRKKEGAPELDIQVEPGAPVTVNL